MFEVTQDSVTLDTPITVYGYDVKVLVDLRTVHVVKGSFMCVRGMVRAVD